MSIPGLRRAGWALVFGIAFCGVQTSRAAESPIGAANRAFAIGLYHQLDAQPGNLFFSPASIQAALAMAAAGARGETQQQMDAVLHLAPGGGSKEFGDFLKTQTGGKAFDLSIANSLWAQQGYAIAPDFIKTVQTDFGAGFFEVDFRTQTEAARQKINDWVAQATSQKIKDLIPPRALQPLTRMVLANAIYFKGSWESPFQENATRPGPFHLANGQDKQVPLMEQQETCGYSETPDFQVLSLLYQGERLSMVLLLPRTRDGLPALEKRLTPEMIEASITALKGQLVRVILPRFKLTSDYELAPVLAAMGMKDAFTDADFSGITTGEKLVLSGVFHKAYVDVNERGTEAAAATGVVAVGMAMVARPTVFQADHPFLFLIRDNQSGACLFMGRMTTPD